MTAVAGEGGRKPPPLRRVLLVAGALAGFASNSLLCRAALAPGAIDPASFTAVRLASGALALAVLAALAPRRGTARPPWRSRGSLRGAALLFVYAIAFSIAYLRLGAGPGALVLFSAVQLTMVLSGVAAGERPSPAAWTGWVAALLGLAALVAPGMAAAPDPVASALMALAGAAWGGYSLAGRGARDPLGTTAGNFARALPLAAVCLGAFGLARPLHATPRGLLLAAVSGALASGVGYALWYAALPSLSATRAALLQLLVPVLAATLGVALLGERPTPRLVGAGAVIVGGVALGVAGRRRARTR